MNTFPVLPKTDNTLPFQINIQESQEDADANAIAPFLRVSSIVAQKFDEVIANPSAFFDLSKTSTQFNSVSCAVFTDDLINAEVKLNLVYTSREKATKFHHEKTVLLSRHPQSFGFRECQFKNTATVILSFPSNKLFNALLNKLPSIYSFAIQSTYQAVGEVSPKTHVTKWIESGSWPYDGDANDLMRIKNAFHDAHHIIRSIQSNHLLANVLLLLKNRLKEKDRVQLFKNKGAVQLSNDLEILHNEGSNSNTRYFYIEESKIEYNESIFISYFFNGVISLSDFPMQLQETEENYKTRCRLHKKIFPYPESIK